MRRYTFVHPTDQYRAEVVASSIDQALGHLRHHHQRWDKVGAGNITKNEVAPDEPPRVIYETFTGDYGCYLRCQEKFNNRLHSLTRIVMVGSGEEKTFDLSGCDATFDEVIGGRGD